MPTPDDIVYDASVRDKTGDFFDRFDKRLDEISKHGAAAFKSMEDKIGGIGKTAGLIGGVIGGVAGSITGMLTDKLFEIGQGVYNFAQGANELRARADTLAVSLALVGKNAGYTEDQLAGIEEGMRKTGITILATRQSMAQWIQANLDLGKASEVARVAQNAAVIAGVNSSEAFQRITHAAITLQPEIIRSLGLVVNMQEAMKRYAAETGKAVSEISIQEKQQIFLNEALASGTKIAGAYEAAMTTVGKKQASLQRITEDLQIALGAVFQPAMARQIDYMSKTLSDLTKYLEEHEDELIAFGELVASVFGVAITVLEELTKTLIALPGYIKTAGLELAQLLGNLSDEELAQREAGLGTAFIQSITLLLAGVKFLADTVGNILSDVFEQMKLFREFIAGDISFKELSEQLASFNTDKFMYELEEAYKESLIWAGKLTGAIEETDTTTEELGETAVVTGEQLVEMGEEASKAFDQMNASLAKFYRSMQDDLISQQIQEARDAIESALQESYRLEDQARQHQEAVSAIMENASEERRNAMEGHSEALLDIEKNYRKRLRDIQRNFEYEATELARARDAIGLLRLKRQKDRELNEAKIARNDAKKEADKAYQENLRELDQQRQQALQDLAEQERREEELYQQGLRRQEELQRLHNQWEEEDRRRAYAQRLSDLVGNMEDSEDLTDDGLDALYDRWSLYFGDLLEMARQRHDELQQYINPATDSATPTNSATGGGVPRPTTVVGQGGQVSQLLASPSMLIPQSTISNVPAVVPTRSSDRRQIEVNVRGEAMDPHIQRQLALALEEIERNRGI